MYSAICTHMPLSFHYPKLKMVTNKWRNKNSAWPMDPRGPQVFLFWGVGGWGAWICYFCVVLNVFPSDSQSSQGILPMFPVTPRIYPICFAQSSAIFTHISWSKGDRLHLSIENSKTFRSLQSFLFFDEPIKMADYPKKKKGGKKELDLGYTSIYQFYPIYTHISRFLS